MVARDGTLWGPANISSVARCMVLACLAVVAGAFLLTAFQQLAGIAITVLGIVAIAFLNGGNDLPKSIATLIGSNTLSPRRALALGAICTLLGGLAAVFGTGKLLTLFSGGGITLVTGAAAPLFPLAVIGGATTWVLYATKTGLPVSTTHALVGASVGGALVTMGIEGVRWTILLITVVAPLLFGPLAASVLGYAIGKITSKYPARNSSGLARTSHLLSAGGASFARALNDTPENRWGGSPYGNGGLIDGVDSGMVVDRPGSGRDGGRGSLGEPPRHPDSRFSGGQIGWS